MYRIRFFALSSTILLCAAVLIGLCSRTAHAGEARGTGEVTPETPQETDATDTRRARTLRQVLGSVDLGLEGAALALVNRTLQPVRGPASTRTVDPVGTLGLGTVGPAARPQSALPAETAMHVPRAELEPAARTAVNRAFAALGEAVEACYSAQPGDSRPAFDDIEVAVVLTAEGAVTSARISDAPRLSSPSLSPCVEATLAVAQFPQGLVSTPAELRYRWLVRFARAS